MVITVFKIRLLIICVLHIATQCSSDQLEFKKCDSEKYSDRQNKEKILCNTAENSPFLHKNGPLLNIGLRQLLGSWKWSLNGRKFAAFEGIPYAVPPIGLRRFTDPMELDVFTESSGFLNATLPGSRCIGIEVNSHGESFMPGGEDCLFINVYTPDDTFSNNLPVVFYVHGGGFTAGCGDCFGPEKLMDKDLIFVSFNYRVGLFGFLTTEDEVVPGNMGMKDQVLALRWVQKNIRYFGGNPDSVTLHGLSSGGSAIDLLSLSPMTRGLFHRGYAISGSSLNPYVISMKSIERVKIVANDLNCPINNNQLMVDCLRRIETIKIVKATMQFKTMTIYIFLGFGPTIENPNKNAFLTKHPYEYLEGGDFSSVPWIATNTANEGLLITAGIYDNHTMNYLNEYWENLAPKLFNYNWNNGNKCKRKISRNIKRQLFNNRKVSIECFNDITTALGDRLFTLSCQQSAILRAKNGASPVYYYIFNYIGKHSLSEVFMKKPEVLGVCHADDGLYIVNDIKLDSTTSKMDRAMTKLLINMLYSFIVDGKPQFESVQWDSLDRSDVMKYLDISSPEKQEMKSLNNTSKQNMWHSLGIDKYENYYNTN